MKKAMQNWTEPVPKEKAKKRRISKEEEEKFKKEKASKSLMLVNLMLVSFVVCLWWWILDVSLVQNLFTVDIRSILGCFGGFNCR